ncbi:MAG: hypothetical protein WC365_06230 [Candidatus Babeliales bacterium]|jgi:hypothetical protein
MRYFILAIPDETCALLCEDKDNRITEVEEIEAILNDIIIELIGKEPENYFSLYECADDPQVVDSINNEFKAKTAWSTINGTPLKLTVFTTKEDVKQ